MPETVIERKGYYYGSPLLEEGLRVAFLLLTIREGFRKQKWKFRMAFAMKGGWGPMPNGRCHLAA